MKNIVLIGMPGAGKSTVGVVLAKALGMQFIDTDLIIQQKNNEILQEIIDKKGLEFFLKTEQEVICDLSLNSSVIATGGSAVLSEKAMKSLRENGIIVYLEAPLEEIKSRISNITTRGIAMAKDESIDSIFIKRVPLYEKYADITVSSRASFEETVEKIIEEIKNSGELS